jgi:uncharacterized protein (DUF427 family)
MAQLAVVASQDQARSHTGYRLIIEPSSKRIRAVLNGVVVAESDRVLVMHETGYAPVTYVPREDVRMDLMRRTERHTHCPFKGDASYWTIVAGGKRAETAAWGYEDPFEEAEIVWDHIAFDWDLIDAWFVEGVLVFERPHATTAERSNVLSTGWDETPGARHRRRT